jgi:calcium/calmodulin-dependent protein kinase (CaM kinase) II
MELSVEDELLLLNERLLQAIDSKDWDTYIELCDVSLTAYEPEALGQLVEGLPFHYFYLNRNADTANQSTICSPRIRMLGENAACITYVRLLQIIDAESRDTVGSYEETRIWEKQSGQWKHVHFHRSFAGSVELG